jgi:hypothetical protein
VRLDDSLRDRETQSDSTSITSVALPQAPEDVRQRIRRDARPRVRDNETHFIPSRVVREERSALLPA